MVVDPNEYACQCPCCQHHHKLAHEAAELLRRSESKRADQAHEIGDLKAALLLQAQQIERMQQELQCFRPFRLNVLPTAPASPTKTDVQPEGATSLEHQANRRVAV